MIHGGLSFIKRGGPTFEQYKKMKGGTKTLGVIETVDHSSRRVMQRISVEFHHMFVSQRWQKRLNLPNRELSTWGFDEGTFVPAAKLVGDRRNYTIPSLPHKNYPP